MATQANLVSRLRLVSGVPSTSLNTSELPLTDDELGQVLADALNTFAPSSAYATLEAKEEFPLLLLSWANTHLIRAARYARYFAMSSPDGGGDKSDAQRNHLAMFETLMERYSKISEELGVGTGSGSVVMGVLTRMSPVTDRVVPLDFAEEPSEVVITAITAPSSGAVNLTWGQSDCLNFSLYRVYRHTSSGLEDLTRLTASGAKYLGVIDAATEVATIYDRWKTSYQDTGLTAGTTYYYVIQVMTMNQRVAISAESSIAAT